MVLRVGARSSNGLEFVGDLGQLGVYGGAFLVRHVAGEGNGYLEAEFGSAGGGEESRCPVGQFL